MHKKYKYKKWIKIIYRRAYFNICKNTKISNGKNFNYE